MQNKAFYPSTPHFIHKHTQNRLWHVFHRGKIAECTFNFQYRRENRVNKKNVQNCSAIFNKLIFNSSFCAWVEKSRVRDQNKIIRLFVQFIDKTRRNWITRNENYSKFVCFWFISDCLCKSAIHVDV